MLRLTEICKDYKIDAGVVHALKGVSLAFRRNEFVSILGQSGCGKTTLLNIIGGLDSYTSGDLVIQGKSTRYFRDSDWDVYRNHRIGFIFQSYNLIPHQTVLGNVELALTICGIGREERRRRAVHALERVGLGEELNKRPNQLSGGQCQRVAIARALVNDPDILLADEPTGALDSETSVQIMELIKDIAGERLVIMVTHNPDLAERYSTRIVRLKDGQVESDSNPYSQEEEEAERSGEGGQWNAAEEEDAARIRNERRRSGERSRARSEKARTKMSFLSSLALSGKNLLTKKARTTLTAFAGSIGIISVCLVLALSNGFNSYVAKTEEDMLSYYPVQITESAFDVTSIMANFSGASEMPDLSELGDQVYINSVVTGIAQGLSVHNNISETYLDYLSAMDPALYHAIQYDYGVGLSDNLFTAVMTGTNSENVVERYMSLSELKAFYTQELTTQATEYAELAYMVDYLGGVVDKMPGTSDLESEEFGAYVQSQYEVIAGHFPEAANEVVLVVGDNNDMLDLTLAQLGFISEPTFLSLFDLGEDGSAEEGEYLALSYEEILNKEFVLYYNDAVYTANENYSPVNPTGSAYPFTYSGERESLAVSEDEGMVLRVSGILRLQEGMTYGCLSSGLNITEALAEQYIAHNLQSQIVAWMQDPDNGLSYTMGEEEYTLYPSPAEHLNEDFYTQYTVGGMTMYISVSNESAVRYVGGATSPNAVSLYLIDFESKEEVLSYLDRWNEMCESGESYGGIPLSEEDKITYTDTVGLLMGMVQTILDVITYVLVAFTAISLVVSSIMIGIITYVSVVERVKEIGVLRSLGARKQDIRNLFNAETFIIGLAAGLIGVAVTYLLEIPINAIIYSLTGISGIAALPLLTAGIMVLISVALTLISGLIPASAAAKKDPVIALRTE